jgi:hypothetical protein
MRPFIRLIFRSLKKPGHSKKRSFSTSPTMSSAGTAAALYAATISASPITGAVPEEAKDKKHHLQDGKGFTNPWESWRNMSGPQIMKALIWQVFRPYKHSFSTNRIKAEDHRPNEHPRYNPPEGACTETRLPSV